MTANKSSSQLEAAPRAPGERLEVLDVLRGFAILGILLVNMESLSSPGYRSESGERLWAGTADRLAESLISYAASGKFVILFSSLFGLGFALLMERSAGRKTSFRRFYARRLLVLFIIGLMHALLIWFGDILVTYSIAGAFLLLFRRLRPRTILIWAVALNLLSFAELEWHAYRRISRPEAQEGPRDRSLNPQEGAQTQMEAALRAYGQGSFADLLRRRAVDFWQGQRQAYNYGPRIFSFFLLGLFAGRLGIFRGDSGNHLLFRRMLKWSLMAAALAHLAQFLLYFTWLPPWTRLLRLPAAILGNPALAIFYVSALVLLHRSPAWKPWLAPLAAVGRTALSNYLLQSILCTAIFYSYGLGLYGQVGPAAGIGLSFLIFALEVAASLWWLKRFQFGPLEWIWRSLTYGKLQPLRARPETDQRAG